MKAKTICYVGLSLFVLSYYMFAMSAQLAHPNPVPIDFAHWFNLIGAVLLFWFNKVFPKNRLNTIASVITTLGIIAHIGLCTIDFIMWSFGDDDAARELLGGHISNIPSIVYPFIIIGPSLLFLGLALHALNFFKTNTMSALMVIVGAPAVGFSFFVLKNGTYMGLSCLVFALGLYLLLYRNENLRISPLDNKSTLQDIILRYGSFGDALISKISYERHVGDNGRVEVTLNTMNALNDSKFELVKLIFTDVFEVRFVEGFNTCSLVINAAFIFEENDIITFDFFPLIYDTYYKEDPNSDFKIKCKKVEYEFISGKTK